MWLIIPGTQPYAQGAVDLVDRLVMIVIVTDTVTIQTVMIVIVAATVTVQTRHYCDSHRDCTDSP